MLQIDPDKRREWLRALRRFKYGMRVRAKLGVIQRACEQIAAQRQGKHQWYAPVWEADEWLTFLYTCMKNNEFPPELLEGFVKTAEVTLLSAYLQPNVARVLDAVDEVCRRNSVALRRKFGVFYDDGRRTQF